MSNDLTEVPTPSLQATDDTSAAVAKGKRATLQHVKDAVGQVYFISADEIRKHAGFVQHATRTDLHIDVLQSMTVCMIVLKNGFIVFGKTAPADPKNFDTAVGRQFAYEDALRQVWPLMGFELRAALDAEKT